MPELKKAKAQETVSKSSNFQASLSFAEGLDSSDQLAEFRSYFMMPKVDAGKEAVYFTGHSLGLQPRTVRANIDQELLDWANLAVEGHWHARHPWLPYHEFVCEPLARLVGARPVEVVAMNSLTVNLHLLMVSFYRPTKSRYKIIVESGAFPSDQYAVASQSMLYGYASEDAVVELKPRAGEYTLRTEDILAVLDKEGDKAALVLLGDANYLTGQAFEVAEICGKAHDVGAYLGLNLAHGAGNLHLQLHDWDVDFAVWCSYKYLNSGPGGIAGAFVHERFADRFDLPRMAGWWGHNKKTRFEMGPHFDPMRGAEGWQLSNPPIFQLAALRASLEIFDKATMPALRTKSELLTGFMEFLLSELPSDYVQIITPRDPKQRGCQLSLRIADNPKALLETLKEEGAFCDFREPDIIRVAPVPLYNSFVDVFQFYQILLRHSQAKR